MTTLEISNRLKEFLQQGQFEAAQKELFDENIISVEPEKSNLPVTNGLPAVLKKGEDFRNSVENFHSITVSNPIVSNNLIAIGLGVELTFKGQEKSKMDEIIIYQVENGKIIHEQFLI